MGGMRGIKDLRVSIRVETRHVLRNYAMVQRQLIPYYEISGYLHHTDVAHLCLGLLAFCSLFKDIRYSCCYAADYKPAIAQSVSAFLVPFNRPFAISLLTFLHNSKKVLILRVLVEISLQLFQYFPKFR